MIWLISILFVVQIVADAIGDSYGYKARTPSFYWKHNNLAQHICQGAEIGIWLAVIFILTGRWIYPVIYLILRALFFNPVYNGLTGQKFWYIGNTAIIDKIINWIKSKIT
jgi:hypothetical protein